jgi:hypothetical protein
VENLTRLKDESKVAEVGFVQGGIGKAEPASKLVSRGSVFYSPLWVFTRGPDKLDDLSQVRGKRISIGPEGSGVRRASLALLKAADAFDPPTELFEYSMADAGKALKEGRLDAVMTFGSADSALVIELINAPGIQLMNFSQAEAYTRLFPDLSHWRNRSKYYPWYRALKELEEELQTDPRLEQIDEYRERLDRIEDSVSRIRAAVAFYDEIFLLQDHITAVRQKLVRLVPAVSSRLGSPPIES